MYVLGGDPIIAVELFGLGVNVDLREGRRTLAMTCRACEGFVACTLGPLHLKHGCLDRGFLLRHLLGFSS